MRTKQTSNPLARFSKRLDCFFRTFVIGIFLWQFIRISGKRSILCFQAIIIRTGFFFFVENLLSFEYLPVLLQNEGQQSYGKITRILLNLPAKNSFKFNQNRIKPTKSYINLLIKQSCSKITYLEEEYFETAFECQ